jgi:hypothetical protein
MSYKPKKKPIRTKERCRGCGRELTEFEIMYGYACVPQPDGTRKHQGPASIAPNSKQ